jgi:hypothetical protein
MDPVDHFGIDGNDMLRRHLLRVGGREGSHHGAPIPLGIILVSLVGKFGSCLEKFLALAWSVLSTTAYLTHVNLSSLLLVLVVHWQDESSTNRSQRACNLLRRQHGGYGVTTFGGFTRRRGNTSN